MITLQKIEAEISVMPPHLLSEVLDFVQFVKQRHGIDSVPDKISDAKENQDSNFFLALSRAGVVGCLDTEDQLSTDYKSVIDFSAKVGLQK